MPRRKNTRRGRGEGSVFEQPNGSWRGKVTVGYDDEGKQKFRWVSGKTQGEALAKVAAIKQRLSSGTYTDTKLMVGDYLERWLEHKQGQVKPRTAEAYQHTVVKHITPNIGRKKLDRLTPLDVQEMVSSIAAVSGTRTANMSRTVLFSALKQAIRWELLNRNPVEAVDPLKETTREMVLWSPEEVVRFLAVARPHRLFALFYLALSTGMRRGELLGLAGETSRAMFLRCGKHSCRSLTSLC